MNGTSRHLTVAVLTFRRPADLTALLPLLVDQAAAVRTDELDVRILVVDNDPDGGAQRGVAQQSARAAPRGMSIHYEHETVPGISAARNRALDASRGSGLLVFIDDDERPVGDWLAALLATMARYDATAVVGPVVSRFQVEPEPWIAEGKFFDRRRLPTGSRVDVAATNNLLLDLGAVRRMGLRFDLSLGITGGDDTMFTRQLCAAGGSIVWCDEAVVLDVVPATRTTRRWVVLRAVSSGNSWSITSMQLATNGVARVAAWGALNVQGSVRIAGGAVRLVSGLVRSHRPSRAGGVRTMARGTGMILGAWGYRYREYRRDRPTR